MIEFEIKKYESEMLDSVRAIFNETCVEKWRSHKYIMKMIFEIFCGYYLNYEENYCFIAIKDGKAVGYSLGSLNHDKWVENFKNYKTPYRWNIVYWMIFNIVKKKFNKVKDEYPSHLHIDILPDYQGMGIGRELIKACSSELLKDSIGISIHFDKEVYSSGEFYRKCGFSIILENDRSVIYGKRK